MALREGGDAPRERLKSKFFLTRLPLEQVRTDILRDLCARMPPAIGAIDSDAIAAATEGLAGQ